MQVVVRAPDVLLPKRLRGVDAVGNGCGPVVSVDVVPDAEERHEVGSALQVRVAEVDVVSRYCQLGVEPVDVVVVDAVVEVDSA